MLFVTFVIIIIHNSLPQGNLPLCLTVKQVSLFSSRRDSLTQPTCESLQKEEIYTSCPIFKINGLLYFLISSPSLLRNWHPDPVRWLFWDISLPSSWSAGFPNKVIFFAATPRLWFYWPVVWWASRVSLDSATWL